LRKAALSHDDGLADFFVADEHAALTDSFRQRPKDFPRGETRSATPDWLASYRRLKRSRRVIESGMTCGCGYSLNPHRIDGDLPSASRVRRINSPSNFQSEKMVVILAFVGGFLLALVLFLLSAVNDPPISRHS